MQANAYGTTSFDLTNGFEQLIRQKKPCSTAGNPMAARILSCMIKPLEEAAYKNVVDILDEVMINDVKTYAIMDIDAVEKDIIMKLLDRKQPQ